jgi:hypothetical protein
MNDKCLGSKLIEGFVGFKNYDDNNNLPHNFYSATTGEIKPSAGTFSEVTKINSSQISIDLSTNKVYDDDDKVYENVRKAHAAAKIRFAELGIMRL